MNNCSVPSPVSVTVARYDFSVIIACEQIIKDGQEIVVISTNLFTVSTIHVNIFSAIRNLIQNRKLSFRWAETVVVAKNGVDWDLVTHVLQVVVFRVFHVWPQGRPLLELSIEIVLQEVLDMLDTDFIDTPWSGFARKGSVTEALFRV